MKVWVVVGKSESGDDFGPYVFSKKPTAKQIKKLCLDADSDEELDGPGYAGSYVYPEVYSCVVDTDECKSERF